MQTAEGTPLSLPASGHAGDSATSERTAIRLTLIISTLRTGGSEKQLTELALRLPRDRFQPVVVTLAGQHTGQYEERLRGAGIPIVTLTTTSGHPVRRWAWSATQYVSALRVTEPDVVYSWLDETAAFVAPICRAWNIPCLVARRNLIGSVLERTHPLIGWAMRRGEARATLVTANSSAVAADCVARGHHAERIRLTPNGHEVLPALPTPPSSPTVFGYVAGFRTEKGHHRLIDALELVTPGPWRVDLAGDGPLKAEIEARVARAGLQDRVNFLGSVRDVRSFWRDRHIAMLLSDSEGMPNALLEAAFAGRPSIATAVGGIPEVVSRGGMLVSPSNPVETATAMVALIESPSRRESMGGAAWQHVAEAYSMAKMVEAHIAAIEETREVAKRMRRRADRIWGPLWRGGLRCTKALTEPRSR